jgi:hypothetical protein
MPPQRLKQSRQIKVKAFKMTTQEERLRVELFKWRDTTAKAQYALFERFGGDILMHHILIDRIVELAHEHKLTSLQDLQKQTGWCFTSQYGSEILDLIKRYLPKPIPNLSSPFTTRPLQKDQGAIREPAINAPTDGPVAAKQSRAPPICSACGIKGHRSAST